MEARKKDKVKDDSAMVSDYFIGHQCQVQPEKLSKYKIRCGRLRRFWLDISSVHANDIRAIRLYRSHATLSEEKYRNYLYFPLSIHPYSKLRNWLEATFVIALTISNVMVAINFADGNPEHNSAHCTGMFIIDLLYLLNVLANFFTGYVEGNTNKLAVLNLRMICCRYIRTWLAIDFLSSVGCLSVIVEKEYVTLHSVLVAMKILRLPVLIKYLDNVLTVRRTEIKTKTVLELTLLVLSYITWNVYFQFATEYIAEGSFEPVNPRNCSWITIGKLWDDKTPARFFYSVDRAVGMLCKNANMNLINEAGCFETFFIVSWLIGKLLVYHCGLKYTISAFGSESAQAKYYIMMKQVETYMNLRNFPPRIQQKGLKFGILSLSLEPYLLIDYAKKTPFAVAPQFQNTSLDISKSIEILGFEISSDVLFRSHLEDMVKLASKKLGLLESLMLNSISGQLYEDIVMHTSQLTVSEFKFIRNLPKPLLMQIALKLRLVIFIAGDIIYKINTPGDCIYFIDKGCIAIYTESGKELRHAEDGDYFGTVSVIMGFNRPASAVAVTNCELLKLDKEDFERTIAVYPTVFDDMKKEAINRYEAIILFDEHHKAEMKMADDQMRKRQNMR